MGREPGHRDLTDSTLLEFISSLHPSEREAFSYLYWEFNELRKELADPEEDPEGDRYDLRGYLIEYLKFGTSVNGERAKQLVQVLTASGYEGDRYDLDALEEGAYEDFPEDLPKARPREPPHKKRRNGLAKF